MNLLFDFLHPVDINFFKNAIELFNKNNHNIFLIYRDRGPLYKILYKELGQFKIKKIGNHRTKFIYKVFGQLIRDIKIFRFLKINKIERALSFGSSVGFACRMLKIPFISFADDPEYKLTMLHALITANKLIMPTMEGLPKKVIQYRGYKENAYLHPNYVKFNNKVLIQYGIKPKKYVFIREVGSNSLNYKHAKTLDVGILNHIINMGFKIVLSLEDKSLIDKYSDKCIILEEPVVDIFAILKNAILTITSGDTMARESCILGVPNIYTGGRDMKANKEFIKIGGINKCDSVNDIINSIDKVIKGKSNNFDEIIKDKFKYEWDDLTKLIVNSIN